MTNKEFSTYFKRELLMAILRLLNIYKGIIRKLENPSSYINVISPCPLCALDTKITIKVGVDLFYSDCLFCPNLAFSNKYDCGAHYRPNSKCDSKLSSSYSIEEYKKAFEFWSKMYVLIYNTPERFFKKEGTFNRNTNLSKAIRAVDAKIE